MTEPSGVLASLGRVSDGSAEVGLLDRLHLRYPYRDGGPAAKFGLGVELYLPDRDRARLRQQAFDLLLDFWSTCPESVNEYLRQETKRPKKFKGSPAQLIRSDIDRYPVETGYSSALYGSVDIGLERDYVDPYQAKILVHREDDVRLNFFNASIPVCSPSGQPRFVLWLSAVRRWCEMAQPAHGSAGFTVIVSMSQDSRVALQTLERFPGLDFPDPIAFEREAQAVHDRIKCVNWLTVLGDAVLEQLGGLETLQRSLGPACQVHPYVGGVLIQAGPEPRLGDLQRGDIPAPYQFAARVTKPVRFENYDEGLFRVPEGREKRQTALDWIRRFD